MSFSVCSMFGDLVRTQVTVGQCILFLWLAGALIRIAGLLWKLLLHRRQRCSIQLQGPESRLMDLFKETARELGYNGEVRLAVSADAATAYQIGYRCPFILLPRNIWTFSEWDVRNMLRHELCHFLGRDLWVKTSLQVLTCLLWWIPFLYPIGDWLNQSLEMSCDRRACQGFSEEQRLAYLDTLLRLMRNPPPETAGVSAHGSGKSGETLRRFQEILRDEGPEIKQRRYVAMRKIALRGLLGRKRDTALLWTVVVLAFLFLALPTTLVTSLNATDTAQRVDTYGKWQVMGANMTPAAAEAMLEGEEGAATPVIEVSGADYFQGDNTFQLGVYSPELADMGSFQLREGRWPEARNEVALEYARLASLDLEVGDTFTVQTALELPASEEHKEAYRAGLEADKEAYRSVLRENCLDVFRSGDWEIYISLTDMFVGINDGTVGLGENILRAGDLTFKTDIYQGEVFMEWSQYAPKDQGLSFFLWWYNNYYRYANLFRDEENPDGLEVPLEELTEEQFLQAVDLFLESRYLPRYYVEPKSGKSDLLGVDELSAWMKYEDDSPMSVQLTYTYTICGIIDTYTDHWDSGLVNLPSGFITEENYQLLRSGVDAALEKYPDFSNVEFPQMVLLGGGDTSSLFLEAIPVYNRMLLENCDFTAPYYREWIPPEDIEDIGEEGAILNMDNLKCQIVFQVALADPVHPSMENVRSVWAWISMENASGVREGMEGRLIPYVSDRLLGEEEGYIAYYSVWGQPEQLVETEENRFVLMQESVENLSYNTYRYEMLAPVIGDLDTAVVAFDLDGERFDVPLADFLSKDFTVNGLAPIEPGRPALADHLEDQDDFCGLRVNRLAYPASSEGTGTLLALVMGMLFVTVVCAVFQICFTQIRRRLRRVVLMKAMGAETRQIAAMMIWEFLYFWASALPVGAALGLLGAWAVTKALSVSQGRNVLLAVVPQVLLLALLAGTLALLLGMMIPAVMAVGVPLTGRTIRKKPLAPPKKETKQDFFHVSLRGLAAKKGRTVGSFALCTFMMTIVVLCLFLGFRFLSAYRETVVRDGKPDYLLRSAYAMSPRQREEYLAELDGLGVCGEIKSYFVGEDVDLDRGAWAESPLLTVAAGEGAESYPINLYTIDSADPLFQDFQAAATAGSLHLDTFDAGGEVLLAVPLYRDTGKINETLLKSVTGWDRLAAAGIKTTYFAEYDGVFQRDETIQAGDVIQLAAESVTIKGTQYEVTDTNASVTVGAVLYYFPDTGLWPLSGSGEGYHMVASPALLSKLLPEACITRDTQSAKAIFVQQNTLGAMEGNFGLTDFYITCGENVTKEEADTALLIFARNHYMEIEVYHESSEKLLRDSVSNILLACLLGMTAVLLALVIFYNTISSDIEQERSRIGILQSLGVSNRLFTARQAATGLTASSIALAAANLLLWTGVAVFAGATGAVLGNLLWGYPVLGHVLLCLGLAAVIVFLFVLPMRTLRHYLPVENIRAGK